MLFKIRLVWVLDFQIWIYPSNTEINLDKIHLRINQAMHSDIPFVQRRRFHCPRSISAFNYLLTIAYKTSIREGWLLKSICRIKIILMDEQHECENEKFFDFSLLFLFLLCYVWPLQIILRQEVKSTHKTKRNLENHTNFLIFFFFFF